MHKNVDIHALKHIYFLGIGGIGMSALARYFKLFGKSVSGYDRTSTPLTKKLEEEGMTIHYTEDDSLIPDDIDLIVYTPAVPKDHLEWPTLKASNVPILKRAEVLGIISQAQKTIAVAGTHGKTSTSSMITHVLRSSGLMVTGFMGGIVKNYDSNFIFGDSDWVVAEADEFDRSFLHLTPQIAVLLSMDADHLDIYGTHDEMMKSFYDFTMNIKSGGTLLIHHDITDKIDATWRMDLLENNVQLYSFGVKNGWFKADEVETADNQFNFNFYVGQNKSLETSLMMPGDHNVSNAAAALGVGSLLGLDEVFMADGLAKFKGIKRRFEFVSIGADTIYIDDYAHHPKEIHSAIQAGRKLYPGRPLTVVFQPHLFSRTRDFMTGFAEELAQADQLILMPIYPARELPIPGVTTEKIAELIDNQEVSIMNEEEIVAYFEKKKPALIMTLGAGNIDRLVPQLKRLFD